MAKKLRLPLLLMLASLTMLWVLAPEPAFAAQPGTCPNGVGHYTSIQPLYGWAKPQNTGCNPMASSVWCKVANQEVDWECVLTNGTIHPANFVYWSPSFCGCQAVKVCCN